MLQHNFCTVCTKNSTSFVAQERIRDIFLTKCEFLSKCFSVSGCIHFYCGQTSVWPKMCYEANRKIFFWLPWFRCFPSVITCELHFCLIVKLCFMKNTVWWYVALYAAPSVWFSISYVNLAFWTRYTPMCWCRTAFVFTCLPNGSVADDEFTPDTIVDWVEEAKQTPLPELTDETFEHLTQASTGSTTGDWLIML